MEDRRKESFVKGAAVLTASTVIIKVMGALFKLPLANIIGTAGMADFGVAYNIYALLLTVSTAGLPVAMSRMVSEANALGRRKQVDHIFRVSFTAFLALGAVSTLIMLLGCKALAGFMNAPEAWPSIAVLAPALICVCLISAYRGYTQGLGNMVPTSISQIIETLSKLVFGLTIAWLLMRMGKSSSTGAAGSIFGVTVGTALALGYICLKTGRLERQRSPAEDEGEPPESSGRTLRRLVTIGVPIIIGSCMLNLVAIIDTKMIYGRLQSALGYSYELAKNSYGIYFNSQTLYNLPSAFAVPMVTSAIPAIAAYAAQKQHGDASQVLGASLKLMNLLAMPMAVGMGVLATPLMGGLYMEANPAAGGILSILSIASYFVCISMVTNAILQAYGHEWLPMVSIAVGGVCKVVVNYLLLGDPELGILGAAVGSVVCYVVLSAMNLVMIRRKAAACPRLLPLFGKPLLAALVMGFCALGTYRGIHTLLRSMGLFQSGRLGYLLPVVPAVLVGVAIYFLLVVLLRPITRDELQLIPKGDKVAKLLRIR